MEMTAKYARSLMPGTTIIDNETMDVINSINYNIKKNAENGINYTYEKHLLTHKRYLDIKKLYECRGFEVECENYQPQRPFDYIGNYEFTISW